MNGTDPRRLRAPLLTAGCGAALTLAVGLIAGWPSAVPVAVAAAVPAFAYYLLGRTETDPGALLAARADERQTTVRLWIRAAAALVLLVLAAVGIVVSLAANRAAWPYGLILALGVVAFLVGLAVYRSRGGLGDSGVRLGRLSRLDERRTSIALHALQLAGIAMFVVAAVGGAALSGRSGDTALRILAIAFAVAVIVGFAALQPRDDAGSR